MGSEGPSSLSLPQAWLTLESALSAAYLFSFSREEVFKSTWEAWLCGWGSHFFIPMGILTTNPVLLEELN